MNFREFVDKLCDVTGEDYSAKVAQTLLFEVTGVSFQSRFLAKYRSKFPNYLRVGRTLAASFADEVNSAYERDLLEEYLVDQCRNEDTSLLCEAFRDTCPNINQDNAVQLVADQFEIMLNEARKKRKHSETQTMPKDKMYSQQELLSYLLDTIEKIHETVKESMCYYEGFKVINYRKLQPVVDRYKKLCEEFSSLNQYLILFYISPDKQLEEKIAVAAKQLIEFSENMIIRKPDFDYIFDYGYLDMAITNYKRCLNEMKEKILQ